MRTRWQLILFVMLIATAMLVACGTVSSDDDDDDDDEADDDVADDDDVDDDDDTGDDDVDDDDIDDDDIDDDDDDGEYDVGDVFPDFTLMSHTGETQSLSDFAGQVLVLDTMATWCPTCRSDTLLLQSELWDVYHDQGFEVLQLMAENSVRQTPDLEFIQNWRDTNNLEYVVMIDPNWGVGARFNNSKFSIPFYAILDQNGVCVHKQKGLNTTYFSYVINDLLTNPPDPLD
ncbi:MAG: TlpA disulfide reductase family protein [Candidatus Alcyoniella australis]|nr:TlpA disulfide reductase family protein [Candidatus Alcyoniella australis]